MEKKPSKFLQNQSNETDDNEKITLRLSDLGVGKRSQEDFQLQIQIDRILNVVKKTTEKLKVAICIPILLENDAAILHRHLKKNEVDFIQKVCWEYDRSSAPGGQSHKFFHKTPTFFNYSQIVNRITLKESGKGSQKLREHFIDPFVAQILDLLWSKSTLKDKIRDDYEKLACPPSVDLINYMYALNEVARTKLAITAVQQKNRKIQLQKAWKCNKEMQANIDMATEKLLKQREEFGNEIKQKGDVLDDYVNRVEALNKKFRENAKRKILETEKTMKEDSSYSDIRMLNLTYDAKKISSQYDVMLSKNLDHETVVRNKRSKVEAQLCSWLNKYDADIGARQSEFEVVRNGYEEEKAELTCLQQKFNEQEKEYVTFILGEKCRYERNEREAFENFRKNCAAKKIQKLWRAHCKRKRRAARGKRW